MSEPSPLSEVAQDVLDACMVALGDDCPQRSFVSHNAPAWEACKQDQLTVHLQRERFMSSAGRKGRQSASLAVLTIQIVRCVPDMNAEAQPPTVEDLQLSALGLMDDLSAIEGYIRANAAEIFGSCLSVEWSGFGRSGDVVPLGPSGGVGGYSWSINVAVPSAPAAAS